MLLSQVFQAECMKASCQKLPHISQGGLKGTLLCFLNHVISLTRSGVCGGGEPRYMITPLTSFH